MRQIARNGLGDRHRDDHIADHTIKEESTQRDTHDSSAGMDLGEVMDGGERGVTAQPHEATPSHHQAVPPSFRTFEGARPGLSNVATAQLSPSSSDVWAGAISRLQTQVSLNTSMLESHRRQVADIEQAVGRLQQEMGNVVAVIHDMRAELQARPATMEQMCHDSGDMDVLASQIASVTSKANEVDGLRMQVELMKNRMKRFEEHGSPTARPGTSSTHRDLYETTPVQFHPLTQIQQLPPMRTASAFDLPLERPYGVPAPPVVPSQGPSSYQQYPEARKRSSEQSFVQSSQASAYRPAEPLPPLAALSSWRPADGHATAVGVPAPSQQAPPVPFRPHMMVSEAQSSGWAAVNVNHPMKQPFEDHRQSPYEPSSAPGSPKRPRLAPIMPGSNYGDEGYATAYTGIQQTGMTAAPDAHFQSRSRAPSDLSQALPTLASASTSAYRFITSTAEADAQASWQPEAERLEHAPHAPPPSGRGRGRGGRGRGARSRPGKSPAPHQHHDSQELGTPEWEKADFTSSQVSADDYQSAVHPMRGGLVRRSEGSTGESSDRPEAHDFPATPVSAQQQDPFGPQTDILLSHSNKKSRSKPTRNADGVLIRKDGRPDMRSVSSANNLRKVHAKREAERAEADGRTPTSARSLAPAYSNSMSEDDPQARSGTPESAGMEEGDGQGQDPRERHQELMSRIFPDGIEGAGGRGLAGAYFPQREEAHSGTDTAMKEEGQDEDEQRRSHDTRDPATAANIHTTDVTMRETDEGSADTHAAEQQQVYPVAKMEPIEEQPDSEKAEEAAEGQAHTVEQSAGSTT